MSTLQLLTYPGVSMVLYLYGSVMILAFAHTIVLPLFYFTTPSLGGFGFTPLQISLFLGSAGLSQALWTLSCLFIFAQETTWSCRVEGRTPFTPTPDSCCHLFPASPAFCGSLILGGVIGLQTAVSLLEAGYSVKLIAKHLPSDRSIDYTSPWAGAIWSPNASIDNDEKTGWDREAYEYWDSMVNEHSEEAQKAGIHRSVLYTYWDSPSIQITEKGASAFWFCNFLPWFNVAPSASLPKGAHFGIFYPSFCVNSPVYLEYLQGKVIALGGAIIRGTIPTDKGFPAALRTANTFIESESEITPDTSHDDIYAYVNATGLGAMSIVGDEAMFPTRGQTLYVKGEVEKATMRVGNWGVAYAIPRIGSGYTLLGGSMDAGNWDENVDPDLTAKILERCKLLASELLDESGEFIVLSMQVGRRPSRKGGVRVETERIQGVKSDEDVVVVHCYGHGSGGVSEIIDNYISIISLLSEKREGTFGNRIISVRR
ncbi:hypothetical protein G7Y89_g4991 [Cudoniella acicularis]|uniref:FAD dependent oxidoreductase domain-containing protein n=1 Tax=Cudoniella acicularis TaxID=354080 RepID=A0A8H4RPP3_9HELO|nr:hypothetical protein G7Y89_g4991 [Cudoniella acicularis]